MEQAYKHSDVFLTHTWRPDIHGRNNHDRVRLVHQQLSRLGFSCWFDEHRMSGDIKSKMSEGVQFTRSVIVFVTEEYMRKIDSKDDDNCKWEFDLAITQKTNKHILCVVMEDKYNDPANWFGKLKESLGNCLFVSLSGDIHNEVYFKKQMNLITDQLKSQGVVPSQMKKKCEDCYVVNRRSGKQQPLCLDGNHCTYCANDLQITGEAKNYCLLCNIHEQSAFCSGCKGNILNKEKSITEVMTQLFKLLSLDSVELTKFNLPEVEQTIEQFKADLDDIRAWRDEALTKDEELQLNDEEYKIKTEKIYESMAATLYEASILTTSADGNSSLLTYEEKMKDLQQVLSSLSETRKEINQRANDVARTSEDLQCLRKQVSYMKEEAKKWKNPTVHDKYCQCDDCIFERNFTLQMMISGHKYLETLLRENKIDEVKLIITLKRELLELKDESGFSLLLCLTVRFGTLGMLHLLLDSGVQADVTSIHGENVLHLVKNAEIASFLIKRLGVKLLHAKNNAGHTPLMVAYLNNDLSVLKVFKEHNQLWMEEMKDCDTLKRSLDKLSVNGYTYVKKLIEHNTITELYMLIVYNKDIVNGGIITNMNDIVQPLEKFVPFLWCCMYGSLPMLIMLSDCGSDVSASANGGLTALMLAVMNETHSEEILNWLCEYHPNLLASKDITGRSVFHHAVDRNKPELVRILLKYSPPHGMIREESYSYWSYLTLPKSPLAQAKLLKLTTIVTMFEEYLTRDDR